MLGDVLLASKDLQVIEIVGSAAGFERDLVMDFERARCACPLRAVTGSRQGGASCRSPPPAVKLGVESTPGAPLTHGAIRNQQRMKTWTRPKPFHPETL